MVQLTMMQRTLRDRARELARVRIGPGAAQRDETESFPHDIMESFRSLGYLSLLYPEDAGGVEADVTSLCLVVKEIARACASSAITLVGHITGSVLVQLGASPEQQRRFLYPDPDRPSFMAICISEPEAGSDVTSIRTTARRDGDCYVLSGSKIFVTNGGVADAYAILARSHPEDRRGGLSAFFVPSGTPGLTPGKKERKMGLRASATTDLHLKEVRIPADHLLGAEGDGFRLIAETMDLTRAVVAAHATGIAESAFEEALRYAESRVQFGRPISQFQGMQFLLADMATRVETARQLMMTAAGKAQAKDPAATMYSSMAKVVCSDVAMQVATDAVQAFGGNGYMRDYPVERLMRDAKVTQIFEGTNQIQRMVIYKQLQAHSRRFLER